MSGRANGPSCSSILLYSGGVRLGFCRWSEFVYGPGNPRRARRYPRRRQKSGVYWALNPDDGSVRWGTRVGPGGTLGGIEWGSATDGSQVYVAIANNGHLSYGPPWIANTDPYAPEPNGYPLYSSYPSFNGGVWSALDARTGAINWQVPVPGVDARSGLAALGFSAVTVANGVMYASSTAGDMVALDASNGKTLWKYTVGGLPNPAGGAYGATNASAPAIVNGTLYWGAGYARFSGFLGRDASHHFYAFSIAGSE